MPKDFSNLSASAQLYIAAVVTLGALTILYSATSLILHPVKSDWMILAALTLLTGSFSIKVPSVSARISVSEAFVFAAVLAFGSSAATIVVALDTLILTTWLGKSRSAARVLFNMSAGASAIWIAAHLFELMLPAGLSGLGRLDQMLIPVLILALSYFAINSSLIAVALGFERHISPFEIWRQNFTWLSLNYLGGASVALLLVNSTGRVDLTALGVIVPLLVITYLTFRTSWGRLEDANKHVAQLNELYLSTIETLAMAVDAKDQITHGHIRRVQMYAVEVARRLGVKDDQQLKAIEAAALLHDMGKLAIPEHILNKPGKLTPAEFDTMKHHSDLGADLLSSIRFPYPVVPIVRHHHERWDGTGYPAGIAGTDIPLGARILSVVDCFDALNSDRPYRSRLTPGDAFEIIRERRGSMYDPLVVDTFIRAYPEIAPAAIRAGQDAPRRLDSAGLTNTFEPQGQLPWDHVGDNALESKLLSDFRADLVNATSLEAILDMASQCLRHLTPATVYAFYRYDRAQDLLVCDCAIGDHSGLLDNLTMRVGERVTGWSAATRRTSSNSDASLDLFTIAQGFQPVLRSTLSTPVIRGEQLAGVLTAYSPKVDAFEESHRYAVEEVASALAERLVGSRIVSQTSNSNLVRFRGLKM